MCPPKVFCMSDTVNKFDDLIKGTFSSKDVTLDYCNHYTNEHGQYITLRLTYKGVPMGDCVMSTANLLWALELYSKNHCTKVFTKGDVVPVS